jgi:hypothetical protein
VQKNGSHQKASRLTITQVAGAPGSWHVRTLMRQPPTCEPACGHRLLVLSRTTPTTEARRTKRRHQSMMSILKPHVTPAWQCQGGIPQPLRQPEQLCGDRRQQSLCGHGRHHLLAVGISPCVRCSVCCWCLLRACCQPQACAATAPRQQRRHVRWW